jgi:putative nucleotidyltransferase with HDIG domain
VTTSAGDAVPLFPQGVVVRHGLLTPLHRRSGDKVKVAPAVPTPRVIRLPDTGNAESGQRWQARPRAAWLVRLFVFAVPLVACMACALPLSRALPQPHGVGETVLWWAAVLGASMAALLLIERLARRLLPLALLLRLSMLFPDQAPKRYKVAARAWSSRRIQQQLARQRLDGSTDDDDSVGPATLVLALMANLAAHDKRTRGHCERVRAYNDLLAEELGLPDAARDRLRWAALIHDIGKLTVSQHLLNKPGRPTTTEWEHLRAHPTRGAEIIAPLAGWLGPWATAIEQHHERWDGTGYPHGLAGNEISFGARIVAVADAFEVMTSVRPYARPVSAEAARAELAECAGTQFDPMVVRAFLNVSLGRLRKAMSPLLLLSLAPLFARMPRASASAHSAGPAVVGVGLAVAVAIGPALSPTEDDVDVPLVATTQGPVVGVAPADEPVAKELARKHRETREPTVSAAETSAPSVAVDTVAPAATSDGTPTTIASPTSEPSAPPADTTTAGHGRCAGNPGSGIGNGGSTSTPGSRALPAAALQAVQKAAGLTSCG